MSEDGTQGQWDVDLGPDKQSVMMQFNHLSEDGVEAFVTGMPREHAIAFATAVLNAALDICICGECDDEDEQ